MDSDKSRREVNNEYTIDPQPNRGLCLVFDNRNFPDKKDDRIGSENDVWKLHYVFYHLLGFCFIPFINLSASSIRQLLKAVTKVNCSQHQCFVCIMLSHGNEKGITCSDGEFITENEIREVFLGENCPTLAGKPKIFIFQFCRGSRTNSIGQDGAIKGTMMTDAVTIYDVPPERYRREVPDSADIITIHATDQGYKAYRDENRGSIFIDALFNTFNEYKNERINFLTLLTRMNNLVSRERIPADDSFAAQVLEFKTNLTLDLYLTTIQWQDDPETLLNLKQKADLKLQLEIWQSIRSETIAELQYIAGKLQKVCQNVRKARISGGCASAFGGVMAAVGFSLIPITFGGSLALAIPGTAIAIAGATTTIGATAADIYKMHCGNKDAIAATAVDCQLSEAINETNTMIDSKASRSVKPVSPNTTNTGLAMITGEQTVLTLGKVAAKGVAYGSAYATATIAGSAVGGATSLVTVPIDIFVIAVSSYRLHNNKPAKIVRYLEDYIRQLQQELDLYTRSTQEEQDDSDNEEVAHTDIVQTELQEKKPVLPNEK